jgi:Spx/MgsR family transcriptional regulator
MPEQQAQQVPVMYGITNCDTIKKARKWLQHNDIDFSFHDYRKQGVDEDQFKTWLKTLGWEQLINKRGTSWRKLDDSIKASMNDTSALRVMLDNPSIIRRPLMLLDNHILLGFDESRYQQEFNLE